MGYVIEAQELEQYKSESLANTTEFYTIDEKSVYLFDCIGKYEKLLQSGKVFT